MKRRKYKRVTAAKERLPPEDALGTEYLFGRPQAPSALHLTSLREGGALGFTVTASLFGRCTMPSSLTAAEEDEMQAMRAMVVDETPGALSEALRRSPRLLDEKFKGQQTLLHWAVHNGRMAAVKALLALGADRGVLDVHDMTAQQLALAMGHIDLADVLRRPPLPALELTVSDFGPTHISLTWRNPIEVLRDDSFAPIAEYWIECSSKSDARSDLVCVKDDGASEGPLSYTFHDLPAAKSFFFRIWVSSPAGWSLPSPRLCFVTPGQVPSSPPQPELLKVTANGLLISW